MIHRSFLRSLTGLALGFLVQISTDLTPLRAAESPACERIYTQFPSTETVAEARRGVSNVTTRTYSPGHGNQIEFTGSNGNSFLWYPGNGVILPGHWKLERAPLVKPRENLSCSRPILQICFQYGANTYNPVTGSRGAEWECGPYDFYTSHKKEAMPGDPIGLASMQQPPFPLPPDDQPLAQVIARIRTKAQ